MATALTLYGTYVTSSIMSTGNQLAPAGGGASTNYHSTTSPATGDDLYMEYISKSSTTGSTYSTLPTPTGKGWILDTTLLEGQTIPAGNWSAYVYMADSRGTGWTAPEVVVRFYKRSSGAVFTAIGSITKTNVSITGNTTQQGITFSATAQGAMSFTTGDKVYVDLFFKSGTGGDAWTTSAIRVYMSTSATQGVANRCTITTPGYDPSVTTLTRTITADSALELTSPRTITADAALQALGTTRTIGSTVALSALGNTRTITADSALELTSTRTITATSALQALGTTRTITADAALKALGITCTIPATVALLATSERTIPADATLEATMRVIPATVALQAEGLTRTIDADSALALTCTCTILATAALQALETKRTIHATAAVQFTTAVVAQTIAFVYPPGVMIPETFIFADTGVRAAIALSSENNVIINYRQWHNFTSGIVQQTAFTLTFLVTVDSAALITAMIPDMITRIAYGQPDMITIESWYAPCAYG